MLAPSRKKQRTSISEQDSFGTSQPIAKKRKLVKNQTESVDPEIGIKQPRTEKSDGIKDIPDERQSTVIMPEPLLVFQVPTFSGHCSVSQRNVRRILHAKRCSSGMASPSYQVATVNSEQGISYQTLSRETNSGNKMFTAVECVNLEERERFGPSDQFLTDERHRLNQTSQLKEAQERVIISNKTKDKNSPLHVTKTSALSQRPACSTSAASTEDKEEWLQIAEKCLSPDHSVCFDFQSPAYLEDEWVDELEMHFSSETREDAEKTEEAEIEAEILEERTNADDHDDDDNFKILEEQPYISSDLEEEQTWIQHEFPELTPQMDKEIDHALNSGPPDEILSEGFRLKISREDMATLKGCNWLNDEIINFYMNLIMSRSEQQGKPKVYAFNTFFYPKLLRRGHASVKRWTRKMDIFSYDYLVIPVHLGDHWCLAIIDFKKKRLQYFDSMGNPNMQCLFALRQYLCDESLDKKKQEFDLNGWSWDMVEDIPHQRNGSDCGVFACRFAECITREAKINFTQSHMQYFRRLMVYEILKQKLLPF